MKSSYDTLLDNYGEIQLLSSISGVLYWDMNTHMPPAAVEQRAKQFQYISQKIHSLIINPEMGTLLEKCEKDSSLDELQKRNKNQHQSIEFDLNADDENELLAARQKEARLNEVEKVLMSIGEKCLLLLKLFYYEGLKMKEIAAKVGLKSEKVAKNQKYKCLERAKLKLKEQHA